ncbi:MAG: hypothetical protein ACRC2J_19135 [Microcoleaceae cyanobacterium]
MSWTAKNKPKVSITQMVQSILDSGKITSKEHLQLTSAMLADDKTSEEERHQINRIFDYLQIGKIKLSE